KEWKHRRSRFKPNSTSLSRNSSPSRAPILPPLLARRSRPGNSSEPFGSASRYRSKPARNRTLGIGILRGLDSFFSKFFPLLWLLETLRRSWPRLDLQGRNAQEATDRAIKAW